MVEDDSFIFKASLGRAPGTGKPEQMERCVRLPGLCELETSVKPKAAPSEQRNTMQYSVSSQAEQRYKKWPGRSGERENANNEAFSFQPNYQYLIGMMAFPRGISAHHFLAISKSHLLQTFTFVCKAPRKLSKDLVTCMP